MLRLHWIYALAVCVPALASAEDKATLKLERADQLLNAAHRHTIWVNGQNVGLISNGATRTYEFTPKAGKNSIYIEAYDPFVKNPESNRVELEVAPGAELTGKVEWVQNGSSFDLVLKVEVGKAGKVPAKVISVTLDSKMKSL